MSSLTRTEIEMVPFMTLGHYTAYGGRITIALDDKEPQRGRLLTLAHYIGCRLRAGTLRFRAWGHFGI